MHRARISIADFDTARTISGLLEESVTHPPLAGQVQDRRPFLVHDLVAR